jgi:hypothetical protein
MTDDLADVEDRLRATYRAVAATTVLKTHDPGDSAPPNNELHLPAEPRRPPRLVAAMATVAVLVAGAVAAVTMASMHRQGSITNLATGPGTVAALPRLTFDPALEPRRTPLGAWDTLPTMSAIQEYEIAPGRGRPNGFRYLAFTQKLSASGTSFPTATLVLTSAAVGEFDLSAVRSQLRCGAFLDLRGRPAVAGRDPSTGAVTFVWREEPEVAAVLMISGYRFEDAVTMAGRLKVADASQWSSAVAGVSRVESESDRDAVWREFERFRTASDEPSRTPVTTLPAVGDPCGG